MRFKQFLIESKPEGYGTDNPGGDWLKGKQRRAEEDISEGGKGLNGSTTAHVGINKPFFLPTEHLAKVKGAADETPGPGNPKYDAVYKSIKEKGYSNEHAVMVSVNHRGQPYIHEGNNRVAAAHALGVKSIKTEVQWKNGGEAIEGDWSPSSLSKFK